MTQRKGRRSVAAGFLVQVEDVRNLVFFEHRIAPVHFTDEFVQREHSVVLRVDNAALQMRQALEREVVHAEFRVDKNNLPLAKR